MTFRLAERGVRAVLLDIEGTTTPIAFVHDVLFPYARARLDAWLEANWHTAACGEIVAQLEREHAEDVGAGERLPAWAAAGEVPERAAVSRYAAWLMDRDRKSPGLKRLQGLIWEEGYQAGTLRGEVFDDVPPAIGRWREAGLDLAVYSSGSELAQRRLFESTPGGNLVPLFTAFFDTAVGGKREAASYGRIAAALGRRPGEILFISDVTDELAAAGDAGLAVLLSLRPGNPPQPDAGRFESVRTFSEID